MNGYCVFWMRNAKVQRVEFYDNEPDALDAARARAAGRG